MIVVRRIWVLFLAAILAACLTSRAQTPPGAQLGPRDITTFHDTGQGEILDTMIHYDGATTAGQDTFLTRGFRLRKVKDGDSNVIEFIAVAPECRINSTTKIGSDPGPLQIFTPTTNFYTEGAGFWMDQSRRLLDLSNNVQTRILKSLLKTPLMGASQTNSVSNQFTRVFSDLGHFDLQSNILHYLGHARALDPQGDSSSRAMTVYLTPTNTIRAIHWQDDVVINTTNRGQATGQSADYVVTNGAEKLHLEGDATWTNGLEEAHAATFDYDSAAHHLDAAGHVRVRWPNPPPSTNTLPPASTNTFAVMFSDKAALQWPPTNGPIESMIAEGNVILVNQSDLSRALGDKAVYSRSNNLFQLTGHPMWWNDRTRAWGDLLSADLTNHIYHADGHARLEMIGASDTNQLLRVLSDHLEWQSNRVEFHGNVTAFYLYGGELRDTLHSRDLTADLIGSSVHPAIATGDVRGETAPGLDGVRKTIRCDKLIVWQSPSTGSMERASAETGVEIEQFGGANALRDILQSDFATALFLPVANTNQLDQAFADGHVKMTQLKETNVTQAAVSEHAVYDAGTNQILTLTGHPVARARNYLITNANRLFLMPHSNALRAFGQYIDIPIGTNVDQNFP